MGNLTNLGYTWMCQKKMLYVKEFVLTFKIAHTYFLLNLSNMVINLEFQVKIIKITTLD